MNKKFNSGLAIILPNKRVNLFIIFVILLGIISGSIFLMILNENDKTLVIDQISTFISNINSNNINNFGAFKNAIYENLVFVILIWILGMSMIGIIINIFLVYMKGFILGFSVSSLFLVYKYKGLLASVIYVFPTSIINVITTIIISVYSILFTINLWKIIFLRDHTNSMGKFLKKYLLVLFICLLLCLVSSLSEAYLIPSLLKLIIKLFI